jgi:hypothetical protein
MDGTLDVWDILQEQREAVLSVKVMHTFKEGKEMLLQLTIQSKT